MKQVIPNYDRNLAPAIALPDYEHKLIPVLKGIHDGLPRDLLANDIKNLKKFTETPNENLKKLINLNKQTYPEFFSK